MKAFFIKFLGMCIVILACTIITASTSLAATYSVDSDLGGTTGTGLCTVADTEDCTFEDAIGFANANPGSTIDFKINNNFIPNQTYTITLVSAIDITEAVTIDAFTQDDAQPNSVAAPGLTDAVMRVVIDGSALPATPMPADDFCIRINTKNADDVVSIKGLTINRCPDNGIKITGNNKIIQGNYIGTDDLGTAKVGNISHGIYVNSAHDILIGGPNPADRNVISGNKVHGIVFTPTVYDSYIEGNFIGLDATGLNAVGNGTYGIRIGDNLSGIKVSGITVGNGIADSGNGKRNYIAGNGAEGIYIEDADASVSGLMINNNYIGTNVNGALAVPNASDGLIIDIGANVSVLNNLISGNGGNGLTVNGGSNIVQGNFIGTDAAGTTAIPNTLYGVEIINGSLNLVGGPNTADRNIISGNTKSGVAIFSIGNNIEGNYIGLDSTGAADLGNSEHGVILGDGIAVISGNKIGESAGDPGDGKRNYISGNAGNGIYIILGNTTKSFGWNQFRNNYIGTDITGTSAVPNDLAGIRIHSSMDVEVEENLISGNSSNGIFINGDTLLGQDSSNNTVNTNKIGTDASGINPLGNIGAGILLENGTNVNYIGDGTSAGGNIIAFNTAEGILLKDEKILGATRNAFLANSIFGNGALGIDLAPSGGADGVTLNDAADPDIGANDLMNFPIVTSAVYSAGNTTVSGTFNGVPATGPYRIELFANDAPDPSGHGEGQTYIGTTGLTGVTTDPVTGDAAFSAAFAGDFRGKFISAIAHHEPIPGAPGVISSSEFGPMTSTDLSITKTISAAGAKDGDNVSFSVRISNISATDATDVQVTDALWGGLSFISYTATQGTYTSSTGLWDIGTLTAGSSATLNVYVYLKSCGTFNNTATITRIGQFDINAADNTATATAVIGCRSVAGGSRGGSNSYSSSSEESAAPEEGFAVPEEAGYCSYSVEPKDASKITRFEFTKMMLEFNCYTIPAEMPEGEKSFSDYPRKTYDDPETNAVMTAMYYALDNGIISGYPDGTLRPFEPIIYAEAAKIIFISIDGATWDFRPILTLLPKYISGSEWFIKYFLFMIDLTGEAELNPLSVLTLDKAEYMLNDVVLKWPK